MRWGAALLGAALVLSGLAVVAPATSLAPASPASAATIDCPQLATGLSCTFEYKDTPAGTTITIPDSVDEVTVMLAGAAGAGGGNDGDPGPGGMMIATIDVSEHHALDVWLGERAHGREGGEHGWAGGGDGAVWRNGHDGNGGGAASGLAYPGSGPSDPLLVAGGGGGGGGSVLGADHGGAGGAGGDPPGNGANGQGNLYGVGGTGGSEHGIDGGDADGNDEWDDPVGAGGGGGGGGHHGGAPGTSAFEEPKFGFSSAGGGGGGSSWASSAVTLLGTGAAPLGDGFLTIYPGAADEAYECDGSNDARTIQIPPDVVGYGVIAVGGAGGFGNNRAQGGHGAVVSGILDTYGMDELQYWVGCSGDNPSHAGHGYGTGGAGGHAPSFAAKDGARGGGATALQFGNTMLFAAGGGGGAGGDISNCESAPGSHCGGQGGSGGGTPGSRLPANGVDGDGGTGGDGGHANAHHKDGLPDKNGGAGVEPGCCDESGGGGGGGSGYPMGGDGGHHDTSAAGGGGGAGGSYVNKHYVTGGFIATSGAVARKHDPANGYLLLLPIRVPLTDLAISKEVTGDAGQYSQGPFTATVHCEFGGHPLDRTLHFNSGDTHVIRARAGSVCTITETGTGGASTPPPPQTLTLAETPNIVRLDNVFDATSMTVQVRSEVVDENNEPTDTVTIDPGQLSLSVQCTVDGHHIELPAPVQNGTIHVDGAATFAADGTSVTIDGLPVGAECIVREAPGSGATVTGYIANGEGLVDGQPFHLVAAANTVEVGNGYALTAISIDKAVDGNGAAPPDAEFAGTAACTLNGNPVTFQSAPAFSSLTVGGGVWLHGVPVHAQCTITETEAAGAHAVTYSPARTVPIAPQDTVVRITNTFDETGLVVSAGPSGAGAATAHVAYTLHATCTLEDATVLDETVDIPAVGGWVAFPAPVGATCTVVQESASGASAVYYSSRTDPTPSTDPVTITTDETGASLHVDNRFDTAAVQVAVTTEGAGRQFAEASAITIGSCAVDGQPVDVTPGNAEATLPFTPAGGHVTLHDAPVGADCTATLTDTGGATSATMTVDGEPAPQDGWSVPFRVQSSGTEVAFALTFDVAALAVDLELAGDAAWAANAPYEVQVTCTLDGAPIDQLGTGGAGILQFEPDGTPVDDRTREVLSALPVGASCALDETADGGATSVGYSPDPTVVLESSGTSATVTNTFDAAALTVTKSLGGNDAAAHALDPFSFELGCTFNGIRLPNPPTDPDRALTFVLTDGGQAVFDALPVGAECLVHEFDSRHAVSVTPESEQSATLGPDGAALAFTNTFDVATLTVRELVIGPGAETYGEGQAFLPEVICSYADGSEAPLPDRGHVVLDAEGDFTASLEVPVGTDCTAEQSMQLATIQTVSDPVDIVLGDDHELAITSEYQVGALTVTKSALGNFDADQPFAFEIVCTWPDPREGALPVPLNGFAPETFSLTSGGQYAVEALAHSTCTTTETSSAGALRVVSSATGAAAVSGEASASVVAIADEPAAVAVTNYMPGSLPVTGAELGGAVSIALALLALGLALALAGRRLRARRSA